MQCSTSLACHINVTIVSPDFFMRGSLKVLLGLLKKRFFSLSSDLQHLFFFQRLLQHHHHQPPHLKKKSSIAAPLKNHGTQLEKNTLLLIGGCFLQILGATKEKKNTTRSIHFSLYLSINNFFYHDTHSLYFGNKTITFFNWEETNKNRGR